MKSDETRPRRESGPDDISTNQHHYNGGPRQELVYESWVFEEGNAIRRAREDKIARLEALGVRRDPGMSDDEIGRVCKFIAMVDRHYGARQGHGRAGVDDPGPSVPFTSEAA